jgi:4-methyl-5(b-hydroxyethyl)-thiazole monophosphate biosynthesis
MASALVILATGFEEVEVITPIDYLRRAGINVTVAGLDGNTIQGAHCIGIQADRELSQVTQISDVLILPGGLPGSNHLAASEKVRNLVSAYLDAGKFVAAICAAPAFVLAEACQVVKGKKITGYPGTEGLIEKAGGIYSSAKSLRDGQIITGKGPGAAVNFALEIIKALLGEAKANEIVSQILM